MHLVIIALLVVVVLILLGLFGPALYVLALGVAAFGSDLLVIAGLFVAALIGLFAYHAVRS